MNTIKLQKACKREKGQNFMQIQHQVHNDCIKYETVFTNKKNTIQQRQPNTNKKFTEENNTAITCFKNKQSRLTITKVMIQGERI